MDNDKQPAENKPQVNPDESVNRQSAKTDDSVSTPSRDISDPPPKKPSETSGSAKGATPEKPVKSSSVRPILICLVILLLLTIAAGMAGGWWLYHQQQRQPGIQDDLTALRTDIGRLQQNLAEERRLRSDLGAGLSQADKELTLRMNLQASRLEEVSTPSRKDWKLAEAEYLLRLGNQRLLTERDSEGALALLQSADGILRDLDEVELLPVREVLAKNIVALKSASMVDVDGLFLELKAIAGEVSDLPILAPRVPQSPEQLAPVEAATDQTATWYDPLVSLFHSTLNQIGQIVRVTHRGEVTEPMLSPQQEQLIRLRLVTALELAQLAMLREQQVVYHESLASAQQLLAEYFQLNEGRPMALVEQLGVLQQQSIVQPRTDISSGLNALRDYIDSRRQRHDLDSRGGQQR